MWGYDSIPWIRRVVGGEVTVRRVKEPAEAIEVPDEEDTLWRYLDFVKLLDLLQSRSLYFCRIDKLSDRFEGRWSDRTIMMLRTSENLWVSEELYQVIVEDRRTGDKLTLPKKSDDWTGEQTITHWRSWITHPGDALQGTYVNCWHGGEDESEAMWKLYGGDKGGIAIRTKTGKLIGSFNEYVPDYIGKVKYVSYDRHPIPIATLPPVFYKRSAFSHEREVRVVLAPMEREHNDAEEGQTEDGIKCPMAPGSLIEEIIMGPYSPAWQFDVLQGLLSDLGLNIQMRKSAMDREPLGKRAYLRVNNLGVYFAYLTGPSDSSSCLRIWATCRRDAFIVARERWGLSELDTNSLEVLKEEEYVEDYGCLPETFECVPNRLNTPFQNSLDPVTA